MIKKTMTESDLSPRKRKEKKEERRRLKITAQFISKNTNRLTRKELDALTIELARRAGILGE